MKKSKINKSMSFSTSNFQYYEPKITTHTNQQIYEAIRSNK
jgi:hypothetical protein